MSCATPRSALRVLAVLAAAMALVSSCSEGRDGARGPDRAERTPAHREPPGWGRPVVVGRYGRPWVPESSGLTASGRGPGILWTHNDSGNDPFLFCVDLRARSCGVWRVDGADLRDWEDLARGPGPEPGAPYLYVGDIGDNDRARESIDVYRVEEPVVTAPAAASSPAAIAGTLVADRIVLAYPDRPHDAETLLVHPKSGDLYVITKESPAVVYRARSPLGAAETLERVARIDLPDIAPEPTAGDIAPRGQAVVLATYLGAYEITVDRGVPFERVWRGEPHRIELGPRDQGEAIAYSVDGETLYATSEGPTFPLIAVRRVSAGS